MPNYFLKGKKGHKSIIRIYAAVVVVVVVVFPVWFLLTGGEKNRQVTEFTGKKTLRGYR